jgi:hypothetical protein
VALRLRPISLRAANAYVREVHRHHPPTRGHKWSVSVVDETGAIRGVAIAGRPVAKGLDDGESLEVYRVATDGADNACSMLYGSVRRSAVAMGYKPSRIFTYTLASESGASLRASGWLQDGESSGGSWSRPSRPRTDNHPTEPKIRWRAG